jgi:eukaryotic-like serine/threonine-protein kinase
MEAVSPDRRLAGRYVLESLLAEGGMASVWQARDDVLARPVAVKVLRQDLTEQADFFDRFRTEAIAAARLTHPNIISVFDTGVDHGVCFIVMEYFHGRTLQSVLDARGVIEPGGAVDVMIPVLAALGYAHDVGVIHRDVKPGNILVAPDGRVKVTDFGIAKAAFLGRDLTTTGSIIGTMRYIAPEQIDRSELDGRADLYSAGVVLFELLTGRPPFQAETNVATAMMRLSRDPPEPRSIRPGISRALEAVVLRAMARHPEGRFASAEEMRMALERCRRGDEPTLPQRVARAAAVVRPPAGVRRPRTAETDRTVTLPPRPRGGAFRSWMLIPLLVILVAGAAIGAGLALGRLTFGGPLGVKPTHRPPSAGSATPAPIAIQDAVDVDPEGDGSENPQEVSLAHDGDPSTAWFTDHYTTAAFGGLKNGLGLWIDLGRGKVLTRIRIQSPITGWTFQLRPGPRDHPSAPLADANGTTTFTMGPSGSVSILLNSERATSMLIWITRLGADHGQWAAAISEVTVFGAAA